MERKGFVNRCTAAALGLLLLLGSVVAALPRAETASAAAVKPAPSCACRKCPGETQCCCDHGEAPAGSTCSAPTQEPANAAAAACLPSVVGKLFCVPLNPVQDDGFQVRLPESERVLPAAPLPPQIDKVPIARA